MKLYFIALLFSVYHMTKDGFKVISEEDCTELHYKYEAEKNQ